VSYTHIDAPQRSDDWFAARLGRLTGSRAKDMLAVIKNGEAASRRDLRAQLVVERLTSRPAEDVYVNDDMQRGIDLEDAARQAYEAHSGNLVEACGFLQHTTLMAGFSPDGLVGADGLIEIKCPRLATHYRRLTSSSAPSEVLPQVTHGLWLTGRAWADIVSYDDRFPLDMQLCVHRVMAVDLALDDYAVKVVSFLAEVDRDLAAVRGLKAVA
jgi:hypothetical protein